MNRDTWQLKNKKLHHYRKKHREIKEHEDDTSKSQDLYTTLQLMHLARLLN
jgi:hypothetical protein